MPEKREKIFESYPEYIINLYNFVTYIGNQNLIKIVQEIIFNRVKIAIIK